MREHHVSLMHAPYRVWCRRCGLRVERVPWADPWQRVTHALARAVAVLAPELHWAAVATHYRLNWKTVAHVVEATVLWGLAHRGDCPDPSGLRGLIPDEAPYGFRNADDRRPPEGYSHCPSCR
jgi:hypothetical protein